MKLTKNFTLEEMTHSNTATRLGIENTPGDEQVENLRHLCETMLEPIRGILGVPLKINSGYRSPALNSYVGGSKNSAHRFGLAADFVPVGMPIQKAFERIRKHPELGWDQLILECDAWIHIGLRDGEQRGEVLTASGGPGNWSYVRLP